MIRLTTTMFLVMGFVCAADPLPSAYDLRNVNGSVQVTTRADNQIDAGPCWSFAAYGSVESNLLKRGVWSGPVNDLNLSEQWVRCGESSGYRAVRLESGETISGIARAPNSAGRWDIVADQMARNEGPIYESSLPYVYLGSFSDNTPYYAQPIPIAPLGNPIWPSPGSLTPICGLDAAEAVSGHAAIKAHLMAHGACYVSIGHKDAWFSATPTWQGFGTYHNTGGAPSSSGGLNGHAVHIIGWDDAAVTKAATPGAWLVKNSHPTSASPTMFWVSYTCANFADDTRFSESAVPPIGAFFRTRNAVPKEKALGWNGAAPASNLGDYSLPLSSADRSQGLCVLPETNGAGSLTAIGIYSRKDNQAYTLRVWTDAKAALNNAAASSTVAGTITYRGFQRIVLPEPLPIPAGNRAAIALTFPGTNLPTSGDSDSSSIVQTLPQGANYVWDNLNNRWTDFVANNSDSTYFALTIRGYVSPTNNADPVSLTQPSLSVPFNTAQTFTANANDADAGQTLTWTVDKAPSKGTLTGLGEGASRALTYTPTSGKDGYDFCVLRVSDGHGGFALRTVNIWIMATNYTPTIKAPSVANTPVNTAFPFLSLELNDKETQGNLLTLSVTSNNQTLIPNANCVVTGTWNYRTLAVTPAAGQTGTAIVQLVVSDGVRSATHFITLHVTANGNSAPISYAPSYLETVVNQPVSLTARASDVNNNQTLTWSVANAPSKGSITGLGSGHVRYLSYIPDNNVSGSDQFTLLVNDGNGGQTQVPVLVNIHAIGNTNAAPLITVPANASSNGNMNLP